MSSAMTRPEIPSIVVHNGSTSAPSSPRMERQPSAIGSLSKQTSLVEDESERFEEPPLTCEENSLIPTTPEFSSPHPPSLPVTPPTPSPAVSPSSPPVCSPTSSNSPSHLISSSPNSGSSTNVIAYSGSLPQGPGPGGGERISPSGICTMAVGQSPAAPSGVVGGSCRSRSLELPSQRSSDSEKDAPPSGLMRHRLSGSKAKLLQRSHAMREDTSPPPEILDLGGSFPSHMSCPPPHICPSNSLTVGPSLSTGCPGGPPRRRLRQQGSSQGSSSFEGSSPCLSRDSSMEYTDSSGVDLVQFIIQTLHKNQKDRMMLLKIERELVNLVKDAKRTHHKFPQMSSYQRMLVHRCAAFFGLEHNVDQVGTCVIVNKTRNTRLPELRFKDYIQDELLPPDEPKRSILRREFPSFEDSSNFKSPDRHLGSDSRRSKSFEEREEEYEKVRTRIFSQESFSSIDESRFHDARHHDIRRNSHEDTRWQDPHRHWSFIDSESHRKHYDNHRLRPGRLPKVESLESHDLLHPRSLRPPVFKSHSFGGYSGGVTVLSRGDSVASNPPPSRLIKQDSTGSRFSDHSSSSGYKTQRQDTSSTNVSNTLSTTPSPTAGQHQHPSFGQHGVWGAADGEAQPVMWAVTDMEAVPPGALLINPQSGQPYVNADGSVYRYDPMNPPSVGKVLTSSPKMSSASKDKVKMFHGAPAEGVTHPAVVPAPPPPAAMESTSTTATTSTPLPPKQYSGGGPPQDTTSKSVPAIHTDPSSSSHQSTSDTLQSSYEKSHIELKSESCDFDDLSEDTSSSSKCPLDTPAPKEIRKHSAFGGGRRQDDEDYPPVHSQSFSSHFFHSAHSEGRPFSQDSMSEVGSHLRTLSFTGPAGPGGPAGGGGESSIADIPPSVSASVPQGYMMHRQQQYPQTVFYMPPGNVPPGPIKYVYPQQYQVASVPTPVQGVSTVGQSNVPGPPMGPHATPTLQHLPSMGNIPTLATMPQPLTGSGPPPPQGQNPVGDSATPLPPGYLPSNYAVVAYPSSGLLNTVASTGGGHESGGTTYYCQLPGPAALAPPTPAAGTANVPAGATVPVTSLQQYAITPTSTATTTFPMGLNYYTASGMGNNGVYQTNGLQSFQGTIYAAPPSHSGVPPTPTPQSAVAFRAPTPPQPPCTQGVGMSLNLNSSGGNGVAPGPSGIPGQYIVLPPHHPPTPTSQATPHLFTTFFRPQVQMMSGSTGTPPPQPVLQYGGSSAPLPVPPVTPHTPVFAKPYLGGPAIHSFVPSGGQLTGGGGRGKEENKHYPGTSVGSMPHSSGSVAPVAPLSGPTGTHLLPRPYSFMQSSLAGSGGGTFRSCTPILIPGHPPRHLTSAMPLAAFSFTRPKFKRQQRPRTTYSRSSDLSTPFSSSEGVEPLERL